VLRLRPLGVPWIRPAGTRRSAWRDPDVARFATGELLANAAWASVLTYCGALMIETYGASRATVAIGLGFVAAAMFPGTFVGRRQAENASRGGLVALTLAQAASVAALGSVRSSLMLTLVLLALMAFTNGVRSMAASALGMDSTPKDAVTMMSVRAAANQFGYLLGAAAGGAAVALGGFGTFGIVLSVMFVLGAAAHAAPARILAPAPPPRPA
jgi:predicted MFS family arabinose efflux permease